VGISGLDPPKEAPTRTSSTRAPDGRARLVRRPSSEGSRIRGACPAVCGTSRACTLETHDRMLSRFEIRPPHPPPETGGSVLENWCLFGSARGGDPFPESFWHGWSFLFVSFSVRVSGAKRQTSDRPNSGTMLVRFGVCKASFSAVSHIVG
jgi:hypothetical protein